MQISGHISQDNIHIWSLPTFFMKDCLLSWFTTTSWFITNCINLHLQSRAMGCANLSLFPVWVPNLRNLGRKMLGRSHVSPSNWTNVWEQASLERSGWVRHILLTLRVFLMCLFTQKKKLLCSVVCLVGSERVSQLVQDKIQS